MKRPAAGIEAKKDWRLPFLARVLINALSILLLAYVIPSVISASSAMAAVAAAFVLGLVNAFLRPLVVLFTLPITFLTFGLFLLVINGALLLLAAAFVPGFEVHGFFGAVAGSILISVVSWVLSRPF